MALDILRPTSGTIEVLGRPPGRRNGGDVGFLPEERGLYRQMTALETVIYFGRLKGMTAGDAEAAAVAGADEVSAADDGDPDGHVAVCSPAAVSLQPGGAALPARVRAGGKLI